MNRNWWAFFLLGAFIGYKMKVVSSDNIRSKVAAVDGGLMVGAVTFFLHRLVVGALTEQDYQTLE